MQMLTALASGESKDWPAKQLNVFKTHMFTHHATDDLTSIAGVDVRFLRPRDVNITATELV